MPTQNENALLSATPVLKTGDYARAKAFYLGPLGFEVLEEGGEPARFGIFKRDRAVVFVDGWQGAPAPSAGGWAAYFHTPDADALCEELTAAGVAITRAPEDTVYGMREFETTDPDGNVLCFGSDIESADAP